MDDMKSDNYLILKPKTLSEINITNIHYRSKVWGHPDNFLSSMKTHFYFSNELKIE